MPGRLLALVVALLLAGASAGVSAYAERLPASGDLLSLPKNAPPARASAAVTASSAEPAASAERIKENWHPPLKWPSGFCVYAYANPTVYVDPDGRNALMAFEFDKAFVGEEAARRRLQMAHPNTAITYGVVTGVAETAVEYAEAPFALAGAFAGSAAERVGILSGYERTDQLGQMATAVVGVAGGMYQEGPLTYLRGRMSDRMTEIGAAYDRGDIAQAASDATRLTLDTTTAAAGGYGAARGITGMASGLRRGPEARVLTEPRTHAGAETTQLERRMALNAENDFGSLNQPPLVQVRVNQRQGARRELETLADLQAQYPNAQIQQQVYLRTQDGKRAVDPLTNEGRRLDFVVIEGGAVIDVVETTSQTARKAAQREKELRIRSEGGTFVRDRNERCLLNLCDRPTREDRRQ